MYYRPMRQVIGSRPQFVLFVLTFLLIAPPTVSAQPYVARIIGGTEVHNKQWQFMVALTDIRTSPGRGQFCGGTLIDERLVLTAAHCVEKTSPQKIRALVGRTDLRSQGQTSGERHLVDEIIVHPHWNPKRDNRHDIALLRLASASSLAPALLHNSLSARSIQPKSYLQVAGWGELENRALPWKLRSAPVKFLADRVCRRAYRKAFSPRMMLCAGSINGSTDSCYGDSGGPLVRRALQPILVGVVSWGPDECAVPRRPGVYTRVSFYHTWIERMRLRMQTSIG